LTATASEDVLNVDQVGADQFVLVLPPDHCVTDSGRKKATPDLNMALYRFCRTYLLRWLASRTARTISTLEKAHSGLLERGIGPA